MDTTYHNVWRSIVLPNTLNNLGIKLVRVAKDYSNKYIQTLYRKAQKTLFLIYMCIIFSCSATRIKTVTEEYNEKYTLQQQLLKQGYYDIKNVYNLNRIHL